MIQFRGKVRLDSSNPWEPKQLVTKRKVDFGFLVYCISSFLAPPSSVLLPPLRVHSISQMSHHVPDHSIAKREDNQYSEATIRRNFFYGHKERVASGCFMSVELPKRNSLTKKALLWKILSCIPSDLKVNIVHMLRVFDHNVVGRKYLEKPNGSKNDTQPLLKKDL